MLTEAQKENNWRKFFVRRCYYRSPLMWLLLVRERFPDYPEDQLQADLKFSRKPKKKVKKRKEHKDFRRVQISKWVDKLKWLDPNSPEYNQACNQIVALQQAHRLKKRIVLMVKIKGVVMDYEFHWSTTERRIKDFHKLANKPGMTHEELNAGLNPPFTGE